jgi:hypothetical protein
MFPDGPRVIDTLGRKSTVCSFVLPAREHWVGAWRTMTVRTWTYDANRGPFFFPVFSPPARLHLPLELENTHPSRFARGCKHNCSFPRGMFPDGPRVIDTLGRKSTVCNFVAPREHWGLADDDRHNLVPTTSTGAVSPAVSPPACARARVCPGISSDPRKGTAYHLHSLRAKKTFSSVNAPIGRGSMGERTNDDPRTTNEGQNRQTGDGHCFLYELNAQPKPL